MTYVSDGSTATYYVLPENARELQELISHKDMNAQIGEIFRACYRYGECRHSDRLRDAKKIAFYAQAEVQRLEALQTKSDVNQKKGVAGLLERLAERPCSATFEDGQPPVPWEHAPPRVRYFTRDANGAIDAWSGDRPVLERGAVWCGQDIDMIRWRPSDGKKHQPKIWERPEAGEDDEPAVPWDHLPNRVKWMTRDADGAIDAWDGPRPMLLNGSVWCGTGVCLIRWRQSDGGQHEPKIWERP